MATAESGKLIPEVGAAWLHDFDLDDGMITSSFAGSPGSAFAVDGPKVQKNGLVAAAGITFIHNSFSTTLKYAGEFRGDYVSHAALGEIRFEF